MQVLTTSQLYFLAKKIAELVLLCTLRQCTLMVKMISLSFVFISAKLASMNRVAANRSARSPKQNTQTRQGKGALKTSKNLTTSVPSTRSKSIMNKKRP